MRVNTTPNLNYPAGSNLKQLSVSSIGQLYDAKQVASSGVFRGMGCATARPIWPDHEFFGELISRFFRVFSVTIQ
jgi:hypothetical protein